ncbi:hypothetical protein [Chryseobacterium arthrosphaerae]|uniref:hypothetical protein n=1 Tax=Chryseobacterium arthrosphaerae TaxID=651561 RepID=UPI001F4AEE1B|nr:hypothetical protein [Chryseobacterium arthrosphaerae]MDG4653930.1 hypothetical protein [Chryseobacterium arthrosphaerae]
MSIIGKIIRVNELPPIGERETNVIYQVAEPGSPIYTDYAIDQNGDLKTHAVTDGSIPLELADTHLSISNAEFVTEGIKSQAQYNTHTREKLDQKLDMPSVEGNAQDYPKIVGLDDNGKVAKLPAGDLGKNMMNANLSNFSARSHTLNASFSINTLGNPYILSGLPNKNSDTVNFQKVVVQNTSGLNAVVDSKNLLLEMPTQLTDAERSAWKTKMNGGWSTDTMSVAVISPPVVDKTDRPFWINLKGANLNLPSTSFKVELCTQDSISADTATVVAAVPGSQVQLYTNGIDLTFYYNFKNIPEGEYKIRLWNGVAWYLTSFTVRVVSQIQRISLNNIVWEHKIYNNAVSPAITQAGAAVSYSSDSNVKALADDSTFIAARKTNELIGADEDFYMSVEITGKTATISGPNGFGTMTHFVGLVNASNTVDLLNQTVANIRLVQSYWYPMGKIFPDNSAEAVTTAEPTYALNATFIRRGGSWTVIVNFNNKTVTYTKTGYTGPVAFGMYNMNTMGNTGVSANIVELYKL